MQDEDIIKLYFARSERAITETSGKYGGYCNSIALNILHDREDSEEVVNDSYLKVWNTVPPTRPQSLKAYLGRIVRNLALNAYEKLNSAKRGRSEVRLVLDELAEVIPSGDSTEQYLERKILEQLLDYFLGTLDDSTRRIFVRRYWYMSSIKEIAHSYKLSESAVKMKLKRTRGKLREYLIREGFGDE
ncbi:RNA polymerase sigma-70 factor, ECF subfamily [Ruminococcus sp. YE71]|uniref:RNA polymerase sigma factor n=1 Tax=unclassified Ruminococcus TaxID=2608920 RepID=UPI00088E0CE9|nr:MULTISPECIES: sigma-70 family RNA polymerase sigma factor [unclassified Ruminococcus]SDA20179.1 RNA polymerase sigma-70 factor, ECF subfamily [Ruminococcus sp. YE78]SFW31964.1 RNA polymerase sigma-70 factor, ECF subfamily [Ruminococcus sp. YE71]